MFDEKQYKVPQQLALTALVFHRRQISVEGAIPMYLGHTEACMPTEGSSVHAENSLLYMEK